MSERNFTLDILRTFAIVLMVIFHFIYDLKFVGFIQSDIPDGSGWQQFRWVIISLFFICLGASLTLAHLRQFRPRKFILRTAQIALGALVISIGSYYAIPKNWIFFGVLHFLALSSILAIFFINLPKISFVLGLMFLTAGIFELVPSRWPFYLLFDNLPGYTNDYVAFIPWFGMVLLGITFAHSKVFNSDPLGQYFVHKSILNKSRANKSFLIWPGQHSLSIYLLHQPILIGTLLLIKALL